MDKQQAARLIKETFEKPFDKGQFAQFAKNLLNHVEDAPFVNAGSRIPASFADGISALERLGKYTDGNHDVDILIVHLKREASIERARTMQRNFVARYLNGSRGDNLKDAALVAFVSPNAEDWRFSLVKMDYRFEETESGKTKVKEEFTPARRWSFLVGQNENSHTAQSRLAPILAEDQHNPTLAELEDAFNIEKVTREFFLEYRRLFMWAKDELDKALKVNTRLSADFDAKGVNSVDFSKKLLGQIVFLYFLQKKGWFGVGRDAEWGTGSKHFLRELFEQKHGSFKNYFNDILEPLFYEALRIDRSHDDHYYSRFDCKIPFLNGGLFDPIGNYDWVQTEIVVPDELFSNNHTSNGDTGNGILDVFDRYNFTVREDEPLEKEVAIDPELLGKAYEKFNAIRPDNFAKYKEALKSGNRGDESKFNKQFGVYYTPREIVHYMCQQSLINYLFTELNPKGSFERLGDPHLDVFGNEAITSQTELEVEHTQAPKVPKEDIETFIHLGETVSENEEIALLKQRNIDEGKQKKSDYKLKLPESIRENAKRIDEKLAAIKVCDPAIGSGAFPVGMMSEIVKARRALTPFIQDHSRTPYSFKRNCIEHSLYGVDIDAGAVEIAKLRLWLSLVVDEDDIREIKPLPNLDYRIVCGDSLLGYPYEPMGLERIEQIKDRFTIETNVGQKNKLRCEIDHAIHDLFKNSKERLGLHVTFDYKISFSEVFRAKGGFDVVIGNPPYVRQESIKELKPLLKDRFECFTGVADLFVYFYEKGFGLLNQHGVLAFISSNKYFRSGYGEKLRGFLGSRSTVLQLIDFGDAPVFDAIAYPCIAIVRNTKPLPETKTRVFNWEPGPEIADFEKIFEKQSFEMPQHELRVDGWRLENRATLALLDKLRKVGKPLGEYVNGKFYRGVLTGLNEAFVVDRETRDRLIDEHKSSEEVLKPFLRGRDVKRWKVESADLWLIFTRQGIDINKYPAIKNHLKALRKSLEPRPEGWDEKKQGEWPGRKSGSYKWYEIQDNIAYWQEFEKPKIVYPDIAANCEFAIDNTCFYPDCTLFPIPGDSLSLIGYLNSSPIQWFFPQISPKIRGDFMRFKSIYVSQIPVPSGRDGADIASLVSKMTSSYSGANRRSLEAKIDALIAHAYELTEDEYALILDDLKRSPELRAEYLKEFRTKRAGETV